VSPDHRALAYGHAFVMLAGASAVRADVEGGSRCLALGEHILETYFFESHASAYADERSPDLTELSPYRGQNAGNYYA
jgi:mannose/cellobiose epimerase-like protein (N-acyl-D-glucosamine 2-epimerase family)